MASIWEKAVLILPGILNSGLIAAVWTTFCKDSFNFSVKFLMAMGRYPMKTGPKNAFDSYQHEKSFWIKT